MIERLLPASARSAETHGAGPGGGPLFPAEEALLARAVAKRRREFTSGRDCARRAMLGLGLPRLPLLRTPDGDPRWPRGVVGSITHCPGYCAAAVAATGDLLSVGIDAEVNAPLSEGVIALVSRPEERRWADAGPAGGSGVCWDRLLFSAKEAVFKAFFPLARQELTFQDAVIEAAPEDGRFEARVLVPAPRAGGRAIDRLSGRWLVENGLLLTAVTVPYPSPGSEPAPA
ncbi:4'-phosphopantetheinyl transferase superfamily protein [Streptomyces sp. NBC_00249]|uniref:4'-phosphopantetheinyl transferase family protein n=1 Tax=Streptomyces sp. NBC_00249 TaxID=2975690 RepID=UPI002251DF75|nr:4'-phosphopantetheinyl transferase superfamily protein [Streptomyces sp. NBC_00249]MCX5197372.1 4'-phosphopantetheinyl transferase superfamily protein [Streptomyces sp. NBC_00249]